MKKAIWFVVIIAAFLIVSCASGERDTIVGTWIDEDTQIELKINADGTIYEIEGSEIDNEGSWKMSEKEPWVLSIYEDGELEVEILVKFINNNEMELKIDEETIKMKRK
jgi:hypothetical protein